jgi:FKBP-type peptidyl-prolyl cis-trans isomerase FklB
MTQRITKLAAIGCAALLSMSVVSKAEDKAIDIEDETARLNYSLGYQIGGDFRHQGVEMDADAVVQGIRDALGDGMPRIPRNEMHAILVDLKQKVVAAEREKRRTSEVNLKREGEAFLAANAGKDGVDVTESGLQYRIVNPGDGARPVPTDLVRVNYRGTLVDGKEFDAGEDVTFSLNGVIRGWTEGLQLIGEGGRIELFVPTELAYQNRGPLSHRALIFDVELLEVGVGKTDEGDDGKS